MVVIVNISWLTGCNNFLLSGWPWAVSSGESRRTSFWVPRNEPVFGGRADRHCPNRVGVSIAVAIVVLAASISTCPNKNAAFTASAIHDSIVKCTENVIFYLDFGRLEVLIYPKKWKRSGGLVSYLEASFPGPSTVFPSSSGPQLAE